MKSILIFLLFSLGWGSLSAQSDSMASYQIIAEGGIMVGVLVSEANVFLRPGFNGQAICSRRVANEAFLGLGLGYETFTSARFLPLFADFRLYRSKKSHSNKTQYFGQLGYSQGWSNLQGSNTQLDFNGGLMMHIGMGKFFPSSKKQAFTISIGYKLQQSFLSINNDEGERIARDLTYYNSLSLLIGLNNR